MSKLDKLRAELSAVEAALLAAYSARRVRVESGGTQREIERQSIAMLAKRKDDLEMRISRLGGGGVRIGVPTP